VSRNRYSLPPIKSSTPDGAAQVFPQTTTAPVKRPEDYLYEAGVKRAFSKPPERDPLFDLVWGNG